MAEREIVRLPDEIENRALTILCEGVSSIQVSMSRRSIAEVFASPDYDVMVDGIKKLEELYSILDPPAIVLRPSQAEGVDIDNLPSHDLVANVASAIALSQTATYDQRMELLETWAGISSDGPYRTMPSPEAAWVVAQEQLIDQREWATLSRNEGRIFETTAMLEEIYAAGHRPNIVKHLGILASGVIGTLARAVWYRR